jgi:YHS domain-containing protein
MLRKYNCRIQPRLHSKLFPYFEQALGRRRILDKWFYFYINQPTDPVIVWKSKLYAEWQLQPGTNRYIGTALRNSKEWLAGEFITDDVVESTDEISILELIDTADLDFDSYQITLDDPAHKWGVGNQTLYDPVWIQPVFDWIHDNVKYRWGLEYQGKTYYVSSERRLTSMFKKTKNIIHADNYPNIQTAVQLLFQEIRRTEF